MLSADFSVTAADRAAYDADGFVQFATPLLSAEGLRTVREACERRQQVVAAQGHDGAWLVECFDRDMLARILTEPPARALLELFCGPSPCLASAQYFTKPAHSGSSSLVGWHQDGVQDAWMAWIDSVREFDDAVTSSEEDDAATSSEEDDAAPDTGESQPSSHSPRRQLHAVPLTLWLPLDDVSPATGGLRVLPKLHRHGPLPRGVITVDDEPGSGVASISGTGVNDATDSRAAIGIDAQLIAAHAHKEVGYTLAAGQPAGHHPLTPHCSSRNTGAEPRRVLIMRLLPLSRARWYEERFGASVPLWHWLEEPRAQQVPSAQPEAEPAGSSGAARSSELLVSGSPRQPRSTGSRAAVILWDGTGAL